MTSNKTELNWTKPLSKAEAEHYLLEMAASKKQINKSWSPTNVIEKGQIINPINTFCKDWGWNIKEVRKFLNALKRKSFISITKSKNKVIITINNYDSCYNSRTTDLLRISQ